MIEQPRHEPVVADGLPAPVGPYSPGMMLGSLVLVSGQGATDPATGELAGADVATQTEQVFRNIQAILEAAGTDLGHVLRCGVFLVDMRDFAAMLESGRGCAPGWSSAAKAEPGRRPGPPLRRACGAGA